MSSLFLSLVAFIVIFPGKQTKLQRLLKRRFVASLLLAILVALLVPFFAFRFEYRAEEEKYENNQVILKYVRMCRLRPLSVEDSSHIVELFSFPDLELAITASLLTTMLFVRVIMLWCSGATLDFEHYRKRSHPFYEHHRRRADHNVDHTPDVSTRPTSVANSRFHSISTDHLQNDQERRLTDSSVTQPPPCVIDVESSEDNDDDEFDEDSYWLRDNASRDESGRGT